MLSVSWPSVAIHEAETAVIGDLASCLPGLERRPPEISLDCLLGHHFIEARSLTPDLVLSAFQDFPHCAREIKNRVGEGTSGYYHRLPEITRHQELITTPQLEFSEGSGASHSCLSEMSVVFCQGLGLLGQ